LVFLLLLQGVPVSASQSGSITGVLTTSAGKPAAGVRVSALARPDSPLDALMASTMASISETDQTGVYRLEDVPPGRYYIIAGRMDQPTYYPGVLEMSAGKDVQITPGAAITGMNFAMKDNSMGRADANPQFLSTSWSIPVRVTVENGGKAPVFADGLFPILRLNGVSDKQIIETPLTSTSVAIPLSTNLEYRVVIENLSKRYTVRSIVSGKSNLVSGPLKLPLAASALPPPATPPPPAQGITPSTNVSTAITAAVAASFGLQLTSTGPLPPVPTIEILLAEAGATVPRTGATLSGKLAPPFYRSIEVSGIAGAVYEDGSFEVKNVPPGRRTILARNNVTGTRPVGALIIVGDQDISNLQLQPILEIPRDLDANAAPAPAATHKPGTVLPLATVSGHLVDETTGARFNLERSIGRININGNTVSYTINNTGDFEIQNLLPGRYELSLWIFGGASHSRMLEVRDENMTLEWPVSVPN
jgi:hypothetical protein